MMRFLFFATMMFFGVFLVVHRLISYLFENNALARILNKDKVKLETEIEDLKENLIPLDDEEFKILSRNTISKKIRKGISGTKGIISTIYQEPLFAYACKQYVADKQVLILAHSATKQYTLLFDDQSTKVFINNQDFGTISSDDKLYSMDGRKVLGEIADDINDSVKVIRSKGQNLAHLNSTKVEKSQNSDRVFSLFHSFKDAIDDKLVILTLYHLLLKPKLNI